MKTNSLKSVLAIALISSFGNLSAQWAPIWPGPWAVNGNSSPGISSASPWALGGNMIIPANPPMQGTFRTESIGTLDGPFPFVLKANNRETIYIDQNARVAVGDGNFPSTSAVLDIRGSNGQTSNFRIYGDQDGNVESTTNMRLFYNSTGPYDFEINQGNPGSSAARFSIDAFGHAKIYNNMDVGANMFTGTGARLGVDGQSSAGVLVIGNNGNDALSVANSAGAARFRLWVNTGGGEDTKAHIAGSTQIGFTQFIGMADNTVRLNVDGLSGLNGCKFTTNSGSAKAFYVDNSNAQPFIVYGSGQTMIGSATGAVNQAQLNINSTNANAIDVFDGSAINFRVKNTGYTYCRELEVMTGAFPDYVFDKSYKLKSLSDVEAYIKSNKHLPGFENADHYIQNGIKTSEMFVKQQEKIEELTLYIIELEKRMNQLEKANK